MTRCTPNCFTAVKRNSSNCAESRMRRAETCGTGSRPAARIAATASSVRLSGRPGSEGRYTQVVEGTSAPTSGARCSSRGEISSELAAISSRSAFCGTVDSVALAGNDIGFIQEPEAAVLLQHVARRLQVAFLAEGLGEPC